jgi:ribosome biogenesis protein BRX1
MSKKKNQPVEDNVDGDIDLEDVLDDESDTSDSEESEELSTSAFKKASSLHLPKTRVLMLTSRGVSYRYG